ncbi:MAG: thioredoxin [Candidatus Woesearchaeota archaeon]|nr:thioredoxin [Candidatus Woesearchaeota archaeon]
MEHVTDDNFESEVLKSEKPVIVDFWAEWCGPCRILGPRFEELSKEMTKVKFVKLNVDENQGTAAEYGIRSIPTLLIFKDGEVAGNIVGALPKEMLKAKIESLL